MTKMTKERAEAIASQSAFGIGYAPVSKEDVIELARLAAEHLGGQCTAEWVHDQLNGHGVPVGGTIGDRIKALASQRDAARNTLPQDVRDALQCAADYGPMEIGEWSAKWRTDNDVLCHRDMAARCAAALAAHPDVAQPELPKREIPATAFGWDPNATMVPPFEGDPKECAFQSHPEPISDEHHKANESVRELRDDLARSNAAQARWRDRAEWLLAELRGGGQ